MSKQITLPNLPVSGAWGIAYLNKAGAFKVTAFEADPTKSENEQPSQKSKDKSLRNLAIFFLMIAVLIIAFEIFIEVTPILIIAGIVVAVIAAALFLYDFARSLTIPQAHAQINTLTPTSVDKEITELVRYLGYEKYDVNKHIRLYELVKNKAPLT